MQFRKLPPLPLDIDARNLVDFCLHFRQVEGFVDVYEAELLKLQANRTKRGLKTAAYEATEQLYCQYFNIGRRFSDRESFFVQLSKHKKK